MHKGGEEKGQKLNKGVYITDKKTKWTGFLYRKKYLDEEIVPMFLRSSDPYLKYLGVKLAECGEFVRLAECSNCGTEFFNGYSRCRRKYCPNCEHSKGMIWAARVYQRVSVMVDDFDFYFLTLTVKSFDNLEKMIDCLEKAWRYIKHDNKHYRKLFKDRFVGGLRNMEVKLGTGGHGWHAHYHILMAARKGFQRDIDWLREAWIKATDGLGTQPYIKKIRKNRLINGVLETTKYIIKFNPGQYKDNDLIQLVYGLRHKRRINTFGLFYGLGRQVDKDIENLEQKEKSLNGFICTICGSQSANLIIKHFNQISEDFYRDFMSISSSDFSGKGNKTLIGTSKMSDSKMAAYTLGAFS